MSITIAAASLAVAQEPETTTPSPWQISADRLEYNQTSGAYAASGNVTISREGRTLTADNVQFNQRTNEALARGNVRLVSGEDMLWGDQLQLNLNDETGTLTNGTLFLAQNHLYLSGQQIQKTGIQTYTAEKISVTSCDGTDPAWKLTGRDLKVTVEGYAYAKHSALWAEGFPILYSPYLVFPAKVKRQSGLLIPEFGLSDRKGVEYLQPFFWAINDNSDATVYAHFMTERGLRGGLEYRYVWSEDALGAVFMEGLHDYRIDDGQGDNSKRWGYAGDGYLRTNKDRYWFRMKHNQPLPAGLAAKLDVDVVSDQDYLQEFRTNFNGYDQTRDYFEETFGRTLDDYNDPVRVNRLNINRTWNRFSFNTDLRWNDDVIKRRIEQTDDTLQQLPAISFDGIKQPMGGSPFYYDLASSYTHFYRINGTRGHRADLYPRVYYPFTMFGGLSLEPSAGVRQTAWMVDHYETVPQHGRDSLYRAVYDLQLDMSTEFFRVFDSGLGGSDKLKHAVIPQVVYQFIPEQDQDDFPEFDDLDRIERKNLITYGFNNLFTARAVKPGKDGQTDYQYRQFLRFKLSQSFDINKQSEGDPKPFSAIGAELDLTPGRYIALDTDAKYSPYDNGLEAFNTTLRLWDARGDRLNVDYRYTHEDVVNAVEGVESLRLYSELMFSEKWEARAGFEYNFLEEKQLEALVGLSYKSQCWGIDIDYKDEEGNKSISFVVNLLGLGSIG